MGIFEALATSPNLVTFLSIVQIPGSLSDKCYLFDCSREPPPVNDTPVEDEQEPAPEPEPEQILP